jgi:hypothetical protein
MGVSFRISDVLRIEDQHWPTLFQAGYQKPGHHDKLDGHCPFTDESLHGRIDERTIRQYIREQEANDQKLDQQRLF